MVARFVESEVWRKLLDKPGAFVSFDVVRTLLAADLHDLLRVYAGGGAQDGRVAFGILRSVSTRGNELPGVPWTVDMHSEFLRILGRTVQGHFVDGVAWPAASGSTAGVLWARLDPTGCREFLAAQPLEDMAAPIQQEAVEILAALARDDEASRLRLEAAGRRGGDTALRVRTALESVGIVSAEAVEAWSRRWREEHAPEALDWLYEKWLSYLPVGHPVEKLMAVLGPPSDGQLPDIYYTVGDTRVYVEAYQDTGFSGCHRA